MTETTRLKRERDEALARLERLREAVKVYLNRRHPDDINDAIASPLYHALCDGPDG